MHNDSTAGMFRAVCERLDITQSMGRPGSALDNAVIESWHSTLEVELRRVEHFAARTDARRGVAAWIDDYNRDRRSLGVDELLRVVASDGRPMGSATDVHPCAPGSLLGRLGGCRPARVLRLELLDPSSQHGVVGVEFGGARFELVDQRAGQPALGDVGLGPEVSGQPRPQQLHLLGQAADLFFGVGQLGPQALCGDRGTGREPPGRARPAWSCRSRASAMRPARSTSA
jgi:hypothetical protein